MATKTRKPTPAEAKALITAIRDAEHNRRDYADFFATNARADMIARMADAGWVTGKGRAARITPAGREAVAPSITRIKLSAGHYETNRGHRISRIDRQWFITFPGAISPDVSRSTLAEAWEYIEREEAQP